MQRAERYKRTPEYRGTLRKARQAGQEAQLRTAKREAEESKRGLVGRILHGRTDEEERYDAIRRELGKDEPTLRRVQDPVPESKLERALKAGDDFTERKRKRDEKRAEAVAPALKVLDQTLRPTRAIAGATEKIVEGKPSEAVEAARKGLVENKGPLFGTVLRKAGVPNAVAAPAGFALDVATDPTTYVSFGAGTVAKRAGEKAVRDTMKRASRAGVSREAAEKLAKTARRRAERGASQSRGVTVRMGGREAPGVRRATAAAGRTLRRVTPERGREGVREAVAHVNPRVTPRGVTREENIVARQAERRARATRAKGVREAQDRGRLLTRTLKKEEHEQIIQAIETRTIGKLPEHLREPAIALRSSFRAASRERRRAGLGEGVVGRPKATRVAQATPRARTVREFGRTGETTIKRGDEQLPGLSSAERAEFLRLANQDTPMSAQQGMRLAELTARAKSTAAKGRAELKVTKHGPRERLVPDTSKRLTARVTRPSQEPGSPKEYFARVPEGIIEGTTGLTRAERGSRTLRPGSSKRREASRSQTISEYNKAIDEPAERFSTNVPLVTANYQMETAGAVAQNRLNRELADSARPVQPGRQVDLRSNESIYHSAGGRLVKLNDDQLEQVLNARGNVTVNKTPVLRGGRVASGRLVALNDAVVDRASKISADPRTAPGRAFDFAQGKWKRIATTTPGFHVRNMAGDLQMAYLAQSGRRLPANTVQAARALKRQTQREGYARKVLAPNPRTQATIKVGGKRQNLDEFLDGAMREGVLRSAQVGRELDEFRMGTGAVEGQGRKVLRRQVGEGRVKRTAAAGWRSLNRGFQNREDLMRLSTYKYGLDNGLAPSEAADLAMNFHIDYSDVTQFERQVARRVAPFYTFSARALPMHVKALAQRPGKFAAIEKAREELATAFGLKEDWEGDTPEWKQRAIPFGVRIGGEDVALDVQLPISMLNELPVSFDPKEYANELARFAGSMMSPAFKIPIEAYTNQSLAFRKPIKGEYQEYVAAPSWSTKLPDWMKDDLGIVDDYVDPRSGKKVPGWDPWTNYYFSQIPGLAYQFRQLTTEGSLQSGRQGWQKVSGALGVKADPIVQEAARITELFKQRKDIQDELDKLRARGQRGGKGSNVPRVRDLSKRLAETEFRIYEQSVKRGDIAPLRESQIPNKKLLKPRARPRGGTGTRKPRAAPPGGISSSGGGLGGGLGGGGGGF